MKTLLEFREYPETREGYPCIAFRWTFQVSREDGLWASFVHQHKHKDGKWYDSHTLRYDFAVRWQLKWGQTHIYYDGPHCSYEAGPFVYQTGGNFWTGDCKKCYGENG